jgi:tRNA (Thr-GGU) A37 N-methylase
MSTPPKPDDEYAARPGEVSVELPGGFDNGFYFIGTIHTTCRTRAECPKNPRESKGAVCSIEVDERYAAGLAGIEAFPHVVVLYFLDQARRDDLYLFPMHPCISRGTF